MMSKSTKKRSNLYLIEGSLQNRARAAPRARDSTLDFDLQGEFVLLDVRNPEIREAVLDLIASRLLTRRVSVTSAGTINILEGPTNGDGIAIRTDTKCITTALQSELLAAHMRLVTLTPRQREVLELILDGKINKVIADILEISLRTVETHRASIFKKMHVRNAVELAYLLR